MTLKDLLKQRADLETQIATLQQSCADINTQIEDLLSQRLVDLRKLQGKEFGAINMTFDGYKVTETVTKKVEWDQEKLGQIFSRIMAAGDKPADYMRMKLEVSEKLYADFPDQIKTIFAEARTVKTGKPTLKFEEVA